jgi:hypothetical protein
METTTVKNIDIPDGTYEGFWSGYKVIIKGYEKVGVKTPVGLKGFDIPCRIKIKNKVATVTSLM